MIRRHPSTSTGVIFSGTNRNNGGDKDPFPCWQRSIIMINSSNGNIFRITGPLWGEFTSHQWIPPKRSAMRSFDVFFDVCLNKRLTKPSRRRWFKTPSGSLWHHCNDGIDNSPHYIFHKSCSTCIIMPLVPGIILHPEALCCWTHQQPFPMIQLLHGMQSYLS